MATKWKQYSGIWTVTQQAQALAAGTWPGLVFSEIYGFGLNSSGQLGLNNVANQSSPTQIGTDTDWAQITTGGTNTMAIKQDGTLWGWGANTRAPLGLNDEIFRSSPTQVGALTNWAQVGVSTTFGGAIKTDGTLWIWGSGNDGRTGLNDNDVQRSSPVQIGSDTDWSQIAVGNNFARALKTSGALYAWGANYFGQVGANISGGPGNAVSSPVQIGADTDWTLISGRGYRTQALKTDGTLWTWGRNASGDLGLNDTIPRSSPTQIGALTWIGTSNSYGESSGAIRSDNTLWTWGSGFAGRTGHNDTINRSSPTQVGALSNWSVLGVGGSHSLAIKTDGTLWAFGNGGVGRLGQPQNPSGNISSPVQVGTDTFWTDAVPGSQFSIAFYRRTT